MRKQGMRGVLQFHSGFNEEVSLEDVIEEVSAGFASLADDGYSFDIKPANKFETPLVTGECALIKFTSDYGKGRVIIASTINKYQESPWVRENFGRGPPGLGCYAFTGEIEGCEEDVEELGVSFESLFGEHGLNYTKASVSDAISRAEAERIPVIKQAFWSYALALEVAKGPMADPAQVEWLRERDTKAWQAMRDQSLLMDLREVAIMEIHLYKKLFDAIQKWRKQA